MDDETRQALAGVEDRMRRKVGALEDRVRWYADMHDAEQRQAGQARTVMYAEVDALIAQLNLLLADMADLTTRLAKLEAPMTSQHTRIYNAVQAATAAFSEVLFELLPPDREPLKAKFTAALGDLFAEVIGGATVMAAGAVVGVDQRVSEVEGRVEQLEAKQVGGDGTGA